MKSKPKCNEHVWCTRIHRKLAGKTSIIFPNGDVQVIKIRFVREF
jgi:hypothetical protein